MSGLEKLPSPHATVSTSKYLTWTPSFLNTANILIAQPEAIDKEQFSTLYQSPKPSESRRRAPRSTLVIQNKDIQNTPQPPLPTAPPHSITLLPLHVQVHTEMQGLDEPVSKIVRLYASMLLKDKFEGLDTEEISNHHLSFDAFRRVVERVSRVQFDPIRDKLGWVEILPSRENRHNLIYDELSFQNALGVMQNHTTIATDP